MIVDHHVSDFGVPGGCENGLVIAPRDRPWIDDAAALSDPREEADLAPPRAGDLSPDSKGGVRTQSERGELAP
jgi:hypothetical protein